MPVACRCGGVARRGLLCVVCEANYKREYRKTTAERQLRKGIERMRQCAVETFTRIGDAEMNGFTAAALMQRILRD